MKTQWPPRFGDSWYAMLKERPMSIQKHRSTTRFTHHSVVMYSPSLRKATSTGVTVAVNRSITSITRSHFLTQ